MIRFLFTIILAGEFLFCFGQQDSINNQTNRISIYDNAYMLTIEQIDSLTEQINRLEKDVGSQIAIWTEVSLDGKSIEEISLATARRLKLGRSVEKDGLLIFIAVTERQFRIEVGYGLENIVKDEIAAEVLREDLTPSFRLNHFGAGLYKGIETISNLIIENRQLIGQRPEYLQRWDSLKKGNKD